MKIRDAEYKSCGECGTRRQTKAEAFGCDQCKTLMDFAVDPNLRRYEVTHFFHDSEKATNLHIFCSLTCCFKWLAAFEPKERDFYFVNLPYVSGRDELREFKSLLAFKATASRRARTSNKRGSTSARKG